MDRPQVSITFTVDEVWAVSRAISGTIAKLMMQSQVRSLEDEEQHLVNFLINLAPKVNEAGRTLHVMTKQD